MNKEEILECNKLIIEFMDIKEIQSSYDNYGQQAPIWYTSYLGYRTPAFSVPNKSIEHLLNESKFNNSWDWLMPVVEKINRWNSSIRPFIRQPENVEVTITPTKVRLRGMIWSTEDKNKGKWNIVRKTFKPSNKESVYEAVVEFIKWYNEQGRDIK